MYILQISDLHITSKTDLTILNQKVALLIAEIKERVPAESNLVCCILGDIIEKGDASFYEAASDVLEQLFSGLRDSLGEECVEFEIIPGNHDICNGALDSFNNFTSEKLHYDFCYSDTQSVKLSSHFNYNFVCISSLQKGEYDYGQINFDELKDIPQHSILLTHHALISGDQNDSAPIRNGYRLQTILEEKNAIALLHGHTHGCKRYSVGSDCQVVGAGPMFKAETDISNQCNLIKIAGYSVETIEAYTFHGDRNCWDKTLIYSRFQDNNYYGSSVQEIYTRILKDGEAISSLFNLRFQIKQPFSQFEQEILSSFSEYEEDAYAWQSDICPASLYYTHGQLMNSQDKSWIDFVSEELKNKPTSKRAIVPLLTQEKAFASGDGHLVAFDAVQFGLADDSSSELQITVYFRALELKHFLPINLYEAYIMAKKVRERIRSIQSVTICFFAFRAEVKEDFSCYKRLRIDQYDSAEFCKMIAQNQFELLRELLHERANSGETVIETQWLCYLMRAIECFYSNANKEEILEQLHKTKIALEKLKETREHCSSYSSTKSEEDEVSDSIKCLADMLNAVESEE